METLHRDLTCWFEQYVGGMRYPDEAASQMASLKHRHSRCVAENCRLIASMSGWNDREVLLAASIGLVHDAGRFPQIASYGTFADTHSIDHARLGHEILSKNELLMSCDENTREIVLESVRLHNFRSLPRDVSPAVLPYVKLLRDADKLDIYRVVEALLDGRETYNRDGLGMDLDPGAPPTPEALAEIRGGGTVSHENIHTYRDFYLMQLSWVYDISYAATFRLIADSTYISRIIGRFGGGDELRDIFDAVRDKLRESAPQT